MDPVVRTSRLKLTLMMTLERGSAEFGWLHALRSNEESMFWNIHGGSKTEEDTERVTSRYATRREPEEGDYRLSYAVHELLPHGTAGAAAPADAFTPSATTEPASRFIGLIDLHALQANDLALPAEMSAPAEEAATTVTLNIGYQFLPPAWGKGYAAEAITGVFAACTNAPSFWAPFTKVYVRAIVNLKNTRSQRVMEKASMKRRGVYHWSGEPVFVAGEWKTKDSTVIYGKYLL